MLHALLRGTPEDAAGDGNNSACEDAATARGGDRGGEDRAGTWAPYSAVPVFGMALGAFTDGGAILNGGASTLSFGLVDLVFSCALIAYALSPFLRHSATRGQFLTFRVFLPAFAVLGFAIKLIPAEAVPASWFSRYMFCYLSILMVSVWLYAACTASNARLDAFGYCSNLVCLFAVSSLLGYFANVLPGTCKLVVLGIVTGAFLLYAVATLSISLITYARGTESGTELESPDAAREPVGIPQRCAAISEKYHLSPRENEVLVELAYGHASGYIAQVLYVSPNTARTYMARIYKKLGINSREELIEMIHEAPQGR